MKRTGTTFALFAFLATLLFSPDRAAAQCTDVAFAPAAGSPVGVGTRPSSITTGDFNSDGWLDMAVANNGSGNISILLGDGGGGFTGTSQSPMAIGTSLSWVIAGDFNADNDLDLAVSSLTNNNVTILLGDGTGTFTSAPGSPFTVGSSPFAIDADDIDNDGDLDLAVSNFGSSNVTILLNDGSADFAPSAGSPFSTAMTPAEVTLADFNLDGNTDLATVSNLGDRVTILLGNGAGGFTQATGSPFNPGLGPTFVEAADFDNDDTLDLVVANSLGNAYRVFPGNGNGTFSMAIPAISISADYSVEVVDFNGDGNLDFAAASSDNHNVVILLGDGNFGFTQAAGSPVPAGTTPVFVVAAEIDSIPGYDLAVANYNVSTVTILLDTCGGGGSTPITIVTHPTHDTVCAGYAASFTAAASDGAATVQWQVSTNAGTSWADVAGATSATFAPTAVYANNGNHYRAIFDNGSSSDTTDPAILTVSAPPTMSFSLTPATIWSSTATMRTINASVNVTGGCSPGVQLLSITATENGVAVPGPTLATDVQNATTGADDRSFDLRAVSTTAGTSRLYAITYRLTDGAFTQDYTQMVAALSSAGSIYTGPPGVITVSSPTPNPLTGTSTFTINTTSSCGVRLSVYNLQGIWLTDIIAFEMINGARVVNWNGTNSSGAPLPNGTYILQAKGCGTAATTVISIQR